MATIFYTRKLLRGWKSFVYVWVLYLRLKFFRKKNNKQAWNCPDSLIYYTTYIATCDSYFFLLLHPNFHIFSTFIANDYLTFRITLARFNDSITTYDPSVGEIMLGNNSKGDKSKFLLDEFIFYLSRQECIFLEKNYWSSYFLLIIW